MNKIVDTIKSWWITFNMSSEELYLSKASDHVDLEHRMKIIMNEGFPIIHVDPTFNSNNMGKHRYY